MADSKTFQLARPELQADIYYLTEQEGGRKKPVASGYRGQFHYDGKDYDAAQQFLEKDWCHLGESVQVLIQTASPQIHAGQFYEGKAFEIREGAKVVGKGVVTKVLQPTFQSWNSKTVIEKFGTAIEPYAGADMQGFRIDFEYFLSETGLFSEIEFVETGDRECMLLVNCRLAKKNIQPYLVAGTVINTWNQQLATSHQLYKVELHTQHRLQYDTLVLDRFILTFVTWHAIYLTGQIIVIP